VGVVVSNAGNHAHSFLLKHTASEKVRRNEKPGLKIEADTGLN
jgi:hypothetical protein